MKEARRRTGKGSREGVGKNQSVHKKRTSKAETLIAVTGRPQPSLNEPGRRVGRG